MVWHAEYEIIGWTLICEEWDEIVVSEKQLVWVAVGVIENGQGEIFICQRTGGKHQAGKWEFPGGKVEEGESVAEALDRELDEEIGIRIEACEPLLKIAHDYGDKAVLLDVWRVTRFRGTPYGKEGQPALWIPCEQLVDYDFPVANRPIVEHLLEKVRANSHSDQ